VREGDHVLHAKLPIQFMQGRRAALHRLDRGGAACPRDHTTRAPPP
jgi:hypothetical protein